MKYILLIFFSFISVLALGQPATKNDNYIIFRYSGNSLGKAQPTLIVAADTPKRNFLYHYSYTNEYYKLFILPAELYSKIHDWTKPNYVDTTLYPVFEITTCINGQEKRNVILDGTLAYAYISHLQSSLYRTRDSNCEIRLDLIFELNSFLYRYYIYNHR